LVLLTSLILSLSLRVFLLVSCELWDEESCEWNQEGKNNIRETRQLILGRDGTWKSVVPNTINRRRIETLKRLYLEGEGWVSMVEFQFVL
jgi:hypothetical protein